MISKKNSKAQLLGLALLPVAAFLAPQAEARCVVNGDVLVSKTEIKAAFGDNRFEDKNLDIGRFIDLRSADCEGVVINQITVTARLYDRNDRGSIQLFPNGQRSDQQNIRAEGDYRDYDLSLGGQNVINRNLTYLGLRLEGDEIGIETIRFRFGQDTTPNRPPQTGLVLLGETQRGSPRGLETELDLARPQAFEQLRIIAKDGPVTIDWLQVTFGNGQVLNIGPLALAQDDPYLLDLGRSARNIRNIHAMIRSNRGGFLRYHGVTQASRFPNDNPGGVIGGIGWGRP